MPQPTSTRAGPAGGTEQVDWPAVAPAASQAQGGPSSAAPHGNSGRGSGSLGPRPQKCPECLHIGPQGGIKRGDMKDKRRGADLMEGLSYLSGLILHNLSYPCLLPKCSFRLCLGRSRIVLFSWSWFSFLMCDLSGVLSSCLGLMKSPGRSSAIAVPQVLFCSQPLSRHSFSAWCPLPSCMCSAAVAQGLMRNPYTHFGAPWFCTAPSSYALLCRFQALLRERVAAWWGLGWVLFSQLCSLGCQFSSGENSHFISLILFYSGV